MGFVVALLPLVQALDYFTSRSSAPIGAGAVVLGLGLAVAVGLGVARNSSIGVLVWLLAALFAVLAAGNGPPLHQLAFLALVGGWFISVVTHRRPLRSFGATEGLMVAFVLFNVASAFASHELAADPEFTWQSLVLDGAFFPFALFFLARQTMFDRRAVRSFLWFLIVIGVYLTATMIFYKLGPRALVWPQAILDESRGINPERARGPMLNSAADGITLVMAFIAALFVGSQPGVRFRKLALVAALVMPVAIFLTNTRAVWLAAGVAVVLAAMLARGYRRWYLVVLGGAATVIAINWQKFLSADRQQGGVTSTGEIESRLNDIATALWGIQEKPVFGWGITRFIELNTQYHKAWGDLDWNLGYGFIGHNTPLLIAVELGLVGLALWTAVLVAVVATSVRAWRRLPRSGLLSKGLVFSFWCAAAGWFLNACLIDMRLFPFVNGLIFAWGGVVAGLGDAAARGELEEAPDAPQLAGAGAARPGTVEGELALAEAWRPAERASP